MEELKSLEQFLARFSITSNAFALSVALVALAQADRNASPIAISQAPLWFLFAGMILGGLYAYVRMAHSWASEWQPDWAKDLRSRVAKQREELADASDDDGRRLLASIAEIERELDEMVARAAPLDAALTPQTRKFLGWLEAALRWAPIFCLLVGTALMISNVGM